MAKQTYHHGNLRTSLLDAAEAVLIDNGLDAFSLRRCAKRAGVSHAAPAHHFKDTAAMLQALAAVGFERMGEAMRKEQLAASVEPRAKLISACLGYINFAHSNQQLYRLMFRSDIKSSIDADLRRNSEVCFSLIVNSVGKMRGQGAFQSESGWRTVSAIWSMLHGFADLAVVGRMEFVTQLPFERQRTYLEDMIARIIDFDG